MFNRVKSVALAILMFGLISILAFADSQVRIVRLSSVEGDVQIDRSQGYEKAFLNLPVTQGAKIRTNNDGRAEIEFEDGSTLRLTPGTVVEFPELSLRDAGAKISTVHLQEGTAYVNFSGSKGDQFTMTFGREKFSILNPAHLRVEMADASATLAVFKGQLQIEGPSGTVAVDKKQTATFDLANQDKYEVAKNLEQDPYDTWDKQQEDYHQRYMARSNSYSSYSPYAYGTTDLNYYGNFTNVPGYGNLWQPYFANAGWDPFMNGAWSYSPGFGYNWVSAYPWGWTPYHYGSWLFVPSYGWMWQPGGYWNGYSRPRVINPPARFQVPQPPSSGGGNTVVVNRGPVTAPGISPRQVVIRDGSAGLGVPRGSVKNLSKIAPQVQQKGAVVRDVRTVSVPTATAASAARASQAQAARTSAAEPSTTPSRRTSVATPRSSAPRPAPSSRPMPAPRPAPPSSPRIPH
jgi:hypothetical protein